MSVQLKLASGYVPAPAPLTMLKLAALRFVACAPAAAMLDCDGFTKLPAAFLSAALVKLAWSE